MKYFILIIFFVMMCSQAHAQKAPFKVGISVIPEVSHLFLDKSQSTNSIRSRLTSTGSFGIVTEYSFSEKSGIYSGALYSVKRFNADISNIFLESNNFSTETLIFETLNIGTLLIPFSIYYNLGPHWQIKGGLGFNFLIYETRYRQILNGGDEEKSLFQSERKFYPGLMSLQLGLNRKIDHKYLKLDISPQVWLHTHSAEIPLLARTDYQISFGVELTAWLNRP